MKIYFKYYFITSIRLQIVNSQNELKLINLSKNKFKFTSIFQILLKINFNLFVLKII